VFIHKFGAMSKIFGISEFLSSGGLLHEDTPLAENSSRVSGKMIPVNKLKCGAVPLFEDKSLVQEHALPEL
jgi:hypothetical protein